MLRDLDRLRLKLDKERGEWDSERAALVARVERLRSSLQALEADKVRLIASSAGMQASAAASAAGAAAAAASTRKRHAAKGGPGSPAPPVSQDVDGSQRGPDTGDWELEREALQGVITALRGEVQVLQKSIVEQDAVLSKRVEEVEAARAAQSMESHRARERLLAVQREMEDMRARHRTVDADSAAARQVLQEQLWEVTQELETVKLASSRVGSHPGSLSIGADSSAAVPETATGGVTSSQSPSYLAFVELEQARRVGDALRRELDQARMHASSASLEHRRLLDEERHRAKQDHDRLVEELARVGAALDASKAEVLSLSHARHAQDAALRQAERDLAEAGVRLESARAAAASATAALKADVAAAVENSHRLEQALASAASRARAAEAVLDEERTGRRADALASATSLQVHGNPGCCYCAAFSVRLFLPSWGCPSTFFNSWSCWLVLAHRNFTPNWN